MTKSQLITCLSQAFDHNELSALQGITEFLETVQAGHLLDAGEDDLAQAVMHLQGVIEALGGGRPPRFGQ